MITIHSLRRPVLRAVFLLAGCSTRASAVDVCPASFERECYLSCDMAIPILVSGSELLDAFGFEFVFEGSAIFSRWERGRFVRDWEAFDVASLGPGRLRLGGFEPGGTMLAGEDTLAILHFAGPASEACLQYRTEAFVDDFARTPTCSGAARVSFATGSIRGTVGVFEPMSDSCCYATPDGTTLEVRATLPAQGTFGGTEFRIEVSPPAPGAVLSWQPSAAVDSAVGDPLDNTTSTDDMSGVRLHFATCRSSTAGEILLGTIHIIGLTGEHDFLVKGAHRPNSPELPCAQYESCAACPAITCMPQVDPDADDPVVFRARVNGDCPVGCVAVQPTTWSKVKSIYRD
jgi:hypothetical protein